MPNNDAPRGNGVPHAVVQTTEAQADATPHAAARRADSTHGPMHCHAHAPSVTHLPCPAPAALAGHDVPDALSPAERYAELFVAVQASGMFRDSKTFPDCIPLYEPDAILARYRAEREAPDFSLEGFVCAHFARETIPDDNYVSNTDN